MPSVAFWNRVDQSAGPGGCWPWMGARLPRGYGSLRVNGRHWLAHRRAYALTVGDPGLLDVLHSCDNPPCVNPAHLSVGTAADNMAGASARGRLNPTSLANLRPGASARITADIAAVIRRRLSAGARGVDLAAEFAVSQQLVCDIRHGRRWA